MVRKIQTGKKPLNGLIEFNATAINNPTRIVIGTLINTIIEVL